MKVMLINKERRSPLIIKKVKRFEETENQYFISSSRTIHCLEKSLYRLLKVYQDDDEASPRICSQCGKEMYAGYCIEDGEAYYCSKECLHANMTEEEYLDLYNNGDSYYTEWEDE